MHRDSIDLKKKMKTVLLTAATIGMLYSSPCTVGDVGLNVVNGTLSFVKGYTADVWAAAFPPAEEFFGRDTE